ncbi:MAG: hypothetical protein ABJB12_24345 [Pseudomonadota bacterium]
MTAPQRLSESDDDFERDLIRSAHADRPSQRALERVLLGLGVEFSNLPSAVASSASRTATMGAATPGAATPGATIGGKIAGAVLAKWVVAGVAIGVTAITGAQAIGRALDQPRPRAAQAPKQAVAPLPLSAAAADRVVSSAPPRSRSSTAQPSPSALLPPSAPPRGAASAILEAAGVPAARALSPIAAEPSSNVGSRALPAVGSFALETAPVAPAGLAGEMRLLDAARRELASGDSHAALATLNKYERAFPNGALGPEASVLKVRATLAAGDRAGAEALGQRVIRQAPQSEHADAVRAALGARSNP